MVDNIKAGPGALPGDIVQVTSIERRGALAVVEEVRASGVSGYMPLATVRSGSTSPIPIRLRYHEFVRVGTAAVLSGELAKARAAAIETAQLVAEEAARAAPPIEVDDLTPQWDVEVRVLERATETIQKHRERVRADCVEEALDRITVEGGSLVGVTIDEVAS